MKLNKVILLLMSMSLLACVFVSAQENSTLVEAKPFVQAKDIDVKFNSLLGQTVMRPAALATLVKEENSLICNFSCSAFVPRQAVLDLKWNEQESIQSKRLTAKGSLRLDVSGTFGGFQAQDFGTISLSDIPVKIETQKQQINRRTANQPQALLRMVRAGKVIQRTPNLPVFLSTNDFNNSIVKAELPDNMMDALRSDLVTGSLQQIRLLSKSEQTINKIVKNNVTLEGLQPGLSYRFRLVDERQNNAQVISQQACQVPVCPADFVDAN